MTSRPTTSTSIRRLDAAWHRFGIESRCSKGASSAALARVGRLGSVPRDLLSVLAWHDGSRGREVDGYYGLLSCAEIVRAKKVMDDLVPEFEDTWMPGEWWSREWIPFLEFNGDLICLTRGGSVVSYKAHDAARPLLHRSFRHWLATVAELWERMPDGATEDEQPEFFETRAATRLRRQLNPGYPKPRTARRRPAEKAPKGIEHVCEWFQRGPYEWRIERAAAMVRTYSGRGISRRYHVKTFPSLEKARVHMEAQIRLKLREGYAHARVAGTGRDDAFLAAAGRHLATLSR
jgi:hypothetical protein